MAIDEPAILPPKICPMLLPLLYLVPEELGSWAASTKSTDTQPWEHRRAEIAGAITIMGVTPSVHATFYRNATTEMHGSIFWMCLNILDLRLFHRCFTKATWHFAVWGDSSTSLELWHDWILIIPTINFGVIFWASYHKFIYIYIYINTYSIYLWYNRNIYIYNIYKAWTILLDRNFLWLKGLKEVDAIWSSFGLQFACCVFFIPKLNSWESHELCQNKVYKADRWYSTIWQASKAIDKRSWSPISGLLWNMGFNRNGRRFVPVECPPKLLLLQVGELNTVYST